MSQPSDTPETDAFAAPVRGLGTGYYQALAFARKLERERNEARKDAERLADALRLIVKPLGDETETSGNPCVSPNPEQGRAIAKALAAHEALTKTTLP